MKTVYLIGGTMGVGKTTVCQCLKRKLENSVFLDGDWCWDSYPFQVRGCKIKCVSLRRESSKLTHFVSFTECDKITGKD